ncbi:hypothetical protein [Yersinia intermedia]|uniref:hypothetical protein n=1 Tax=Yersinia intermedia TaxID=631 RepID=UPI000B72F8A0|nr:hypothetical protein [Yersinia intermedia]MDA5519034.1 hypothetical protein [Yersinia intermedia]OWF85747.1 hypothetical protein B4916_23185 [Yersinia intermedia]
MPQRGTSIDKPGVGLSSRLTVRIVSLLAVKALATKIRPPGEPVTVISESVICLHHGRQNR